MYTVQSQPDDVADKQTTRQAEEMLLGGGGPLRGKMHIASSTREEPVS